MTPAGEALLERLQYHVSGAIERGTAEAIVEHTAAGIIASKIQPGERFKAAKRENMIWDGCDPDSVTVAVMNVGNGFEPCICVTTEGGKMVYRGPFEIENEPTDTEMLLFVCEDYFFLKL